MNRKLLAVLAALVISTAMIGVANAFDNHKKAESKASAEEGFTVLFDGSSTEHFRGYKQEGFPTKGWNIEEGSALRVIGKTKGASDIITKEQYGDFDLRWEWKVAPGANSGIMYRVEEGKGPTYKTGPEYQILEDSKHGDGKNAKTSAGALYALIACNEKKALKPVGEWNTSRIVMHDNKVHHYLNGELVVAYTWASDEIKALVAKSKFKNWGEFMTKDKGHIAFQYHNDDVWYRNIRIKDLSSK